MNIADYISAFPGATDDDLISAGFAPQAVEAFRTGYMPPPSGDPSKIQPTVMPANTFGDVASQYGNEYISGGMDLAFNPNVSSYNALPQSMQGGFMEPFNREVMSILDLPLGLLSAAGGISQKAIALGAEAIGSGTQSEERLARDWIGGVEGSGFAPEGRMLAAIADAGGIGAAGRKIAERANQPGPVPTMYSNPIAGLLDNPKSGITAYHGSPHSFDKFSMDKIGTGVGAPDAYSRGLYFAENEGVADHFKRLGASPMIGGVKSSRSGLSSDAHELVWRFAHDEGRSGTLGDVAAAAEADLLARSKELPFSARRDYQRLIDELKARGDEDVTLGANMYEVVINADPSSFADWEAPIASQSEAVRSALANFPQDQTWKQIYESGAVNPKRMVERGVAGTTYKAGDGSRNYVVFDENLINIVKKYGIAGAATMLGVSAIDVEKALADNVPTSQWDQLVVGPQ